MIALFRLLVLPLVLLMAVVFNRMAYAEGLVIEVTDWVKDPTSIAVVPFKRSGAAANRARSLQRSAATGRVASATLSSSPPAPAAAPSAVGE